MAASGCSGDSGAEAERPQTTTQPVVTQPLAQPAVNIAKFRAAFMKSFGNPDDEVLGYGHITGVRLSRGKLEITTDLDPERDEFDSTVRTICLDAINFAFNEGLDEVETGAVIGSDGQQLGSCA